MQFLLLVFLSLFYSQFLMPALLLQISDNFISLLRNALFFLPNLCRHILIPQLVQIRSLWIWQAWERARLGSTATTLEDTGLWLPQKMDVMSVTIEGLTTLINVQPIAGSLLRPCILPSQNHKLVIIGSQIDETLLLDRSLLTNNALNSSGYNLSLQYNLDSCSSLTLPVCIDLQVPHTTGMVKGFK